MRVLKRFAASSTILTTITLAACMGDQLLDPIYDAPSFNSTPNAPPKAANDVYALSTVGGTLNISAPDGLIDGNGADFVGSPPAEIVSFGSGDVGGKVTANAAGTTKSLPDGGSLTVNADGSFDFTAPTSWTGCRRFRYRLQNSIGRRSDARVTIVIGATSMVACLDQYWSSGNIGIEVTPAQGVLSNDPEGVVVASVMGSPANVGNPTPTKATGRNGVKGSVTLQSDGSFTYEAPPGFRGTDFFNYASCSATQCVGGVKAYVYVRQMVWFIDNSSGGSNLGTFSDPFQSIADFNAANGTALGPKAGNIISLRRGTGTYSEADGITLLNSQKLIGEGVKLKDFFLAKLYSLSAYQTFASGTMAHPVIEVTGQGNNGVNLAMHNHLRGFHVGNTNTTAGVASYGIFGNTFGNLLVNSVSVIGEGGALDLTTGNAGNVTFDELSSLNAPERGIRLNGLTGTVTVLDPASAVVNAQKGQSVRIGGGDVSFFYPGTVSNDVRPFHIVELLNTTGGTIEFSGLVSQSDPGSRAILIRNVDSDVTFADVDIGTPTSRVGGQSGVLIEGNGTGTITFEDLTVFTEVNSDTPAGASIAGIRVANTAHSGMLNITTGSFDAVGGPAIDIELIELNLTSVTPISVGSDLDAVRLVDVTGFANINSAGSLTSPTGHGVNIMQSTGAFAVNLSSLNISTPGGNGIDLAATGTGSLCLNMVSNSHTGSNTGFSLSNDVASTFELQDFVDDGSIPANVEAWILGKGNTGTTSVGGTYTGAAGVCVP